MKVGRLLFTGIRVVSAGLLSFVRPLWAAEANDTHPESCQAALLGPPDTSGASCHGPWAYHYFPCYRASRHQNCGVEEFETEMVTAFGTCRHPDFGVETWSVVARAPLTKMGFPNSAPHDIDRDKLERHAREEAAKLTTLLNRDGQRYRVEVSDGLLHPPRAHLKDSSLWPERRAFDEIPEWLDAMASDAWQQGFHYNKGRKYLEEAHRNWHHGHKQNIKTRVSFLQDFFTANYLYYAGEQELDLVISLPVYRSRQDRLCGAAEIQRQTSNTGASGR